VMTSPYSTRAYRANLSVWPHPSIARGYEDMREVLHAYQNTVTGEIVRVGGHVAKLMDEWRAGLLRLAARARG
jgi:hypothetical protein